MRLFGYTLVRRGLPARGIHGTPQPMSPLPPGTTVLQVLPSLETGGVERGTIEITQAIAVAGGRALVTSAGGRQVPAVLRAGGQHFMVKLATKDPVNMLINAGKLAGLVRSERVSILHVRSRAPAWSALWAARRTGVPFVTTYHGNYAEGVPGKRLYNSVMARGDRVIAISQFIADLIIARHGTDPSCIRLIPRGADLDVFDADRVGGGRLAKLATAWRLPDGMPTVMLPARLTRWKGATVLLDAAAQMAKRDVCIVLVGDAQGRGRFVQGLMAQAKRLGLQARLRLAGACDDMPAALMLADVVVSASTAPEAFGRAVVEAQAMGRMVIATDHGGAAETVEQDVTGWRVPPSDPAALAAALDYALSLPDEHRQWIGQMSRASVVANYSTAAMQDRTLAVYEELLRG